jgi:hypothetical protein
MISSAFQGASLQNTKKNQRREKKLSRVGSPIPDLPVGRQAAMLVRRDMG